MPNTLISANVLLPPPRTTRIEEVEAAWNARTTPGHLGRFIKRTKTLIHGVRCCEPRLSLVEEEVLYATLFHRRQALLFARCSFCALTSCCIAQGEVNRIRECGSLIATHTDSPDVLVWDLAKQPERRLDTCVCLFFALQAY